jgi:hypothetical protein
VLYFLGAVFVIYLVIKGIGGMRKNKKAKGDRRQETGNRS